MKYPDVKDFLDLHILAYMGDWYAYGLSCFTNEWINKDMAGAICRDLRNRGYVTFERGLFNEDGEVAGSGYAITKAGKKYLDVLRDKQK